MTNETRAARARRRGKRAWATYGSCCGFGYDPAVTSIMHELTRLQWLRPAGSYLVFASLRRERKDKIVPFSVVQFVRGRTGHEGPSDEER